MMIMMGGVSHTRRLAFPSQSIAEAKLKRGRKKSQEQRD